MNGLTLGNSVSVGKRLGSVDNVAALKAALDAAGYTSNIDALWVFSRDVVSGTDYLVDIIGNNVAIPVGDLVQDGIYGLFQQGGYLDFDFNLNTKGVNYTDNDACFSTFVIDDVSFNTKLAGCYNSSQPSAAQILINDQYRNISNINQTINDSSNIDNIDGFSVHQYKGGNYEYYFNASKLKTQARTSTNKPQLSPYLFTDNLNGAPRAGRSPYRVSLFMISGSWTQTEITGLNTIFNDYMTNIGSPDMENIKSNDNLNYYINRGYVLYQDGNNILRKGNNTMYFSDDNGETWNDYSFSDAEHVDMGYIWDNGNINFAAKAKLYYSDDGLSSVSELTPQIQGGGTYTIHTPQNASRPGAYYSDNLCVGQKMYQDGTEIKVWGNYANLYNGAAPVNIYSLTNNGANLTVLYQFGQNTNYRDDGSVDGGSTGNLLGDSGNSLYCRHVHSSGHDNSTDDYYFCTGDTNRGDGNGEIMWLKGTVDGGGLFSFSVVVNATTATESNRYKSVGINFDSSGNLYFASDGGDNGIYKCDPSDINTPANHTKLYSTDNVFYDMLIHSDKIIACLFGGNSRIITSDDLLNFNLNELEIPTGSVGARILIPDINGYHQFEDFNAKPSFSRCIKLKFK